MAKKRRIPVKRFETKESFQEFINSERDWMYSRILEAIKDAHSNGKIRAVIFDAKIEDSMTSITMETEKTEWENSLSLAIKWYESVEEYEKCSEILNLIKSIRTPILP